MTNPAVLGLVCVNRVCLAGTETGANVLEIVAIPGVIPKVNATFAKMIGTDQNVCKRVRSIVTLPGVTDVRGTVVSA